MDAERRESEVLCYDCGKPYSACGDVSMDDATWRKISPTSGAGGVLCANCTMDRLSKAGVNNVSVTLYPPPLPEGIDSLRAHERRVRIKALEEEVNRLTDLNRFASDDAARANERAGLWKARADTLQAKLEEALPHHWNGDKDGRPLPMDQWKPNSCYPITVLIVPVKEE